MGTSWRRTIAGALLSGAFLGVADASMAIGRYGTRLQSASARLVFGLSDALLVAACVLLASVTVRGLSATVESLPERSRGVVVGLCGCLLGAAFGIAAFSGTGIHRSGVAPYLQAASAVVGALIGWQGWRRRGRFVTLAQSRRGTLRVGALVLALAAYVVHATVLVRLYDGLHSFLAAVAVGCVVWVASSGQEDGTSRWTLPALVATMVLGAIGGRTLTHAQSFRALAHQGAPLGQYPVALLGRWTATKVHARTDADRVSANGPHLPLAGRDLVLVTIDALRADRLTVNHGRGRMPTLDGIAAAGLVFSHAYCTTPHTSYSIASLMLGKFARAVLALPVVRPQETLARRMASAGYTTAGFFPPAVFAVDGERFGDLRQRSFDFATHRDDYADAPDRVREVSAWLATRHTTDRVFVWVHLFEPHEPYQTHPEHPFGSGAMDRYDAEVASADDAIASLRRVFEAAHRRPAWIITADHGEEFGEHGGSFHGTSLYDEQVRVPLVMDVPGVAHRVVDDAVSLVDIAPTVLHGCGLDAPAQMRGHDLGPLALGRTDGTSVYAATASLRMVVEGRYKLILDLADASMELYDLARDPEERINLADTDALRASRMRGMIEAWEASHARIEALRPAEAQPTAAVADGGARGDDDLPDVLNRAIQGDRSVAPEVAGVLRGASVATRMRAAEVLGDLGVRDPVVTDALAMLTTSGDPAVEQTAGLSLALLGDARGHAVARAALTSTDAAIRRRAALGLARLGDDSAVSTLCAWLLDPSAHESARDEVVEVLRALRSPSALATWQSLLADMRLAPVAAAALGELGDPRAIPSLDAVVERPTYPLTVRAAAEALVRLRAADAAARVASSLTVTDPLPRVWPLLQSVNEPGHRVAGRSRALELGPRPLTVSLGGRHVLHRLYLVTRSTEGTTLTIEPYGLSVDVPTGDHEVAIEIPHPSAVSALRVHSTAPMTLVGVAGR